MTKINIKFGYPISLEEQELLSERAVEKDCSVERALCFEFAWIANSLLKRKEKENFFDLVFFVISKRKVIAPKIICSSYIHNRNRMPMLVLEKDFLVLAKDSEQISISKGMVDEFGQIFQTEFDYEYVGFERC
jgi:hypothetical protein